MKDALSPDFWDLGSIRVFGLYRTPPKAEFQLRTVQGRAFRSLKSAVSWEREIVR